jgi:hypothetical protein
MNMNTVKGTAAGRVFSISMLKLLKWGATAHMIPYNMYIAMFFRIFSD